jgi:predicted glycosyltransferase
VRWLIILIFMLSCGPTPKRNAEIITTYEGIVEVHHNPDFNTEQELVNALADDKSPDFIIFSSPWWI